MGNVTMTKSRISSLICKPTSSLEDNSVHRCLVQQACKWRSRRPLGLRYCPPHKSSDNNRTLEQRFGAFSYMGKQRDPAVRRLRLFSTSRIWVKLFKVCVINQYQRGASSVTSVCAANTEQFFAINGAAYAPRCIWDNWDKRKPAQCST